MGLSHQHLTDSAPKIGANPSSLLHLLRLLHPGLQFLKLPAACWLQPHWPACDFCNGPDSTCQTQKNLWPSPAPGLGSSSLRSPHGWLSLAFGVLTHKSIPQKACLNPTGRSSPLADSPSLIERPAHTGRARVWFTPVSRCLVRYLAHRGPTSIC